MTERDDWNNKVEKKITEHLSPLNEWLSKINEDNKDFSWPDIVRAQRALQYLKLAELEIWSMQYEDNPKLIDLYRRDEQIG